MNSWLMGNLSKLERILDDFVEHNETEKDITGNEKQNPISQPSTTLAHSDSEKN